MYVYPDSKGHPTVGAGFNLDDPKSAAVLAKVGIDYDDVMSTWEDTKSLWEEDGYDPASLKTDAAHKADWNDFLDYEAPEDAITSQQDDRLLSLTIGNSIGDAKKAVRGFGKLTYGAQAAVVDMVFNLGINKFKGFRRLIGALNDRNYDAAGKEIMNSQRDRELASRAKSEIQLVKSKNKHCPGRQSVAGSWGGEWIENRCDIADPEPWRATIIEDAAGNLSGRWETEDVTDGPMDESSTVVTLGGTSGTISGTASNVRFTSSSGLVFEGAIRGSKIRGVFANENVPSCYAYDWAFEMVGPNHERLVYPEGKYMGDYSGEMNGSFSGGKIS